MRYQLFTTAERSRSAIVAEFAMGTPKVETWGEAEVAFDAQAERAERAIAEARAFVKSL